MNINPEVSIIIPLYNKGPYIERTLLSVLRQTFENFEVIVINDESTDNGPAIVSSINDSRVRLINQANAGVSAARNRGIQEANTNYVALLDADDEWKSRFLEKVLALRTSFPAARILASSFEITTPNTGKYIPLFKLPEKCILQLERYMEVCIDLRPPLSASSIIIEKNLLQDIGGFPVGQVRGEDIDTWFRLLERASCAYINQPLATYWAGLPQSTCSRCDDDFSSSFVDELEGNIAKGKYQGIELERYYDFLATRQSGIIYQLIKIGAGAQARREIRLAMRSKRFRLQCLKWYIKTFLPQRKQKNK